MWWYAFSCTGAVVRDVLHTEAACGARIILIEKRVGYVNELQDKRMPAPQM